MINKLFQFILKSRRIHDWVESCTEKDIKKEKLNGKIRFGLILIIFSFVVGWGGSAAAGFLALYFKSQTFLIGVPVCYFSSWGIWFVGMYLTGKSSYKNAKYHLAHYIKRKYL